MKLKSLVVNDLYSFGQGVLCTFRYLDDAAKTLIVGINNDEPGADSNGAGKSNVLNVLFWILFGVLFQKENNDDIIRRGQKHGSGSLTFTDGEKDLVIERGHGKGKKKFLKLSYGGVNKTCDTDSATQIELYKLLNISPALKPTEIVNDFINTCYFSSDTVKGFMAKEVKSKQRFEIVERYLGLKRYTYASDEAKAKKKALLDKIGPVLEDIASKEEFINNNPKADLETQIKGLEVDRKSSEEGIASAQKTIEANKERTALETLIPTKKQALDDRRNGIMQHLNALESELNANKKSITEKEQAVEEYNRLKSSVDAHAAEAEASLKHQQGLQTESATINSEIMTINTDVGSLNTEIVSLRGQLTNHYACPQCKTSLMVKDKNLVPVNVEEMTQQLAEAEQKRTNATKAIEEKRGRFTAIEVEMQGHAKKMQAILSEKEVFSRLSDPSILTADITARTQRNEEITKQYNSISTQAQTDVGTMKQEIETLEGKLSEIGKSQYDMKQLNDNIEALQSNIRNILLQIGQLKERTGAIDTAENTLVDLQNKVAEQKKEADIYGFWELGFRQIKMNIIDEFLPDFEDKVNDYLTRLKVDMSVDFDTQKRKAKVSKKDIEEGREFKEEFNVTVYRGEDLLPFGLLSKGQRSRVGSCVGMALRELTKERGSNLFDFFFLDEMADSLDESGLRELVALLDEVPGQKLVISHDDKLKNLIEDTMTVEMTDSVSTVRNE